jgi:hypothetical protein
MRERARYVGTESYEREEERRDYRNGYYERDFVTRLGTLRLRIARARGKSFLPAGLKQFQRRAEEVLMLVKDWRRRFERLNGIADAAEEVISVSIVKLIDQFDLTCAQARSMLRFHLSKGGLQ